MRTFLTFIHQLLNSLIPHIQVILLVRTFLTLEGVVAPVDPSFNVYEAALPWAVQRALSPSNAQAKSALRATLLQDDNTPQWERLNALVAEQQAAESAKDDSAREEKSSRSEGSAPRDAPAGGVDPKASEAAAAGATTPLDSVQAVLGSAGGTELRRIAWDLDSTQLLLQLASPSSRAQRRMAVDLLAGALSGGSKAPKEGTNPWPKSDEAIQLKRRRDDRLSSVGALLVRSHVMRQLSSGWRGAAAIAAFSWLVMRVGIAAVVKAAIAKGGQLARGILAGDRAATGSA